MDFELPPDDAPADSEWRENLPEGCPLPDAAPLEDQILIRMIGPDDLADADFDSYTAMGYECPSPDKECQWSACSMFKPTVKRSFLIGLKRFPRLRNKNAVAFVHVDQAAGRGFGEREHVSVWFRKQFQPLQNVVNQVSLDEYEPA